jgi:prepilin-type N-terminal cleavage/methylation domain-containing protein
VMRRGFSLVELILVVAIIAILAAIAVPRFSRGTEAASQNALIADLAVLHRAIDHYAAEHEGRFPDTDVITEQLLFFTDPTGDLSRNPTPRHIFGPYLRAIPPLPLGPHRGSTGIAASPGAGIGWLYDERNGRFIPNLDP